MDNIYDFFKRALKRNCPSTELILSAENSSFINSVKKALDNDEFEVYYQPQYNYNTKLMCGAEALMRWKIGDSDKASPAYFIPLLEKSGMIYEADKIIWEKVCRDMRHWKNIGLNVPHISVNISGVDMCHKDFEARIVALVEKYALEPEDLHLEITETAYVKNLEFMTGIIASMQKRGFVVEMDDFGSGYSSLKTLKNVPFDVIKLDMEFVQESETSEKAKNILTSVIDMLKKIKIPVIVEGVECEKQAELLNKLGCSYMQGYYFGKPTDGESFEKLLKKIDA